MGAIAVKAARAAGPSWGLLLAERADGQGLRLVRLADAVRGLAAIAGLSEGRTLALLADRWAAPDSFTAYMLQGCRGKDCYAEPVTDATEFDPGRAARQAGARAAIAPGNWATMEAPRTIVRWVSAAPERPQRIGKAGALAILAKLAAGNAGAEVLDDARRLVSWLAVPADAVAAIAGELRSKDGSQVLGPAVALAAVQAAPADRGRFTKAGALPSDEDLKKERDSLAAKGNKAPTATLAKKYAVSVDTIQRAVKRGAPKKVSSVFDLAKTSTTKKTGAKRSNSSATASRSGR
jgi:hypothetical protein